MTDPDPDLGLDLDLDLDRGLDPDLDPDPAGNDEWRQVDTAYCSRPVVVNSRNRNSINYGGPSTVTTADRHDPSTLGSINHCDANGRGHAALGLLLNHHSRPVSG